MTLFTSILQDPDAGAPRDERRRTQRFAIPAGFPLKAVLSYIGRDDTGAPMSHTRQGWNWKGRLVDCSEEGARLQLGAGLNAIVGESCDLKLTIEDFTMEVPCHVTNLTEGPDGVIFGLEHAIDHPGTKVAYRQLVEVLALGATLRPRFAQPVEDKSGYLVEQFTNDRPARLTAWRDPASRRVVAFEFLLKENLVQAAVGQAIEYLVADGAAGATEAPALKAMEIQRLFSWVLPNLPAEIPADLRDFLHGYV